MALSVCASVTDLHKKELLKHGTISFPIACYEDILSIHVIPWHWHEEWELIHIEKGTAVILLENVRVTLSEGDGLFINSGVLHTIDRQLSANAVLHSAVFHPRLVGGSIESVYWEQLVLPFQLSNAPRYIILHQNISLHKEIITDFQAVWDALVHEEEGHEILIRYLLSKIIGILCKNTEVNDNRSLQDQVNAERIRSMLTYISENLSGHLNTKLIADSACVSESVCLRCFHHILGTTPMQYVKQSRLNKAAELLRNSSITAKAAALECGFHDISYFTKSFREQMGCTPKEYQKTELDKRLFSVHTMG